MSKTNSTSTSKTSTSTSKLFYKLEIQGIVYLVDPDTTVAYTNDPADPTAIGKIHWTSSDALPTIELFPDWQQILSDKRKATVAASVADSSSILNHV